MIDTQQEIIASSSDQSFLNKSLLNNLIGLDSPQQSFILPPFRNEQFDTVTVSIALPILSYENYILGQLVLTYDLQLIKPKLERSNQVFARRDSDIGLMVGFCWIATEQLTILYN